TIKADAIEEDRLLELALEAGAEDVKNEEEVFEVITAPADLHKVKDALDAAEIPIEAAEAANVPDTQVTVDEQQAQVVLRLIEATEDHASVENVSHSPAKPDSTAICIRLWRKRPAAAN